MATHKNSISLFLVGAVTDKLLPLQLCNTSTATCQPAVGPQRRSARVSRTENLSADKEEEEVVGSKKKKKSTRVYPTRDGEVSYSYIFIFIFVTPCIAYASCFLPCSISCHSWEAMCAYILQS